MSGKDGRLSCAFLYAHELLCLCVDLNSSKTGHRGPFKLNFEGYYLSCHKVRNNAKNAGLLLRSFNSNLNNSCNEVFSLRLSDGMSLVKSKHASLDP